MGIVIVVDDDFQVRRVIERQLVRRGVQAFGVDSGAALIERLEAEEEGIELILMDQRMPGATGIETARLLRANNCRAPIAIMSGDADAIREEATALGLHLLSKPFQVQGVLSLLDDDGKPIS